MMYGVIAWINGDDYVTFIHNEDGSVKVFSTLEEADSYANRLDGGGENLRVASLEGVQG
ncbi:MAG: hypothetical protein QXQ87_04615 [Halobacteria archaeon]